MIEVSWTQLKAFLTQKSASLQYVDLDERYWLGAFDGPFTVNTFIHKTAAGDATALTDFTNNYMAAANKPTAPIPAAFASKTIGNKKLYARNTGFQQALTVGSNELNYTETYPQAKVVGIEVIGGEILDTAELRVYDTATGTYSGIPNLLLNQFGYTLNIAKDYYQRISPFDADIYQGMILKFTYVSVSAKTIGVNIIQMEVKT